MRHLILSLCLATTPAFSQTYTTKTIHFSQLGTFTLQQLEDASGLHAGATLTAVDLSAAAQRLSDTGYFEDVGATLDGKINAVTVNFNFTPIDTAHLLPVGFENFVWLTHDEIMAAVRARFPLFNGYLAENSPRQDDMQAALTAALAAKSIPAEVAADTFEPTLRHPRREIGFHIVKPSLRVANIKLSGVTPVLVPLIQKSANSTVRTAYTEGPAPVTTAELILAPLLDAGYIQAALTNVIPTPGAVENGAVPVVLSATLQPGEIFHVSTLTFAGTPLFSPDELSAAAKLHAGDVASRRALLDTLAPLDAAYRRKGYMDVVIDSNAKADEASHLVTYTITVTPGEQYRVKEVTANNLDPTARADFDRGFLMKTGELYNPEYVATFLKKNTALRALEGYSAAFKAYADPNTHTVDVVITFVRAAR